MATPTPIPAQIAAAAVARAIFLDDGTSVLKEVLAIPLDELSSEHKAVLEPFLGLSTNNCGDLLGQKGQFQAAILEEYVSWMSFSDNFGMAFMAIPSPLPALSI